MDENSIFEEQTPEAVAAPEQEGAEKKVHVASLVLGIIGLAAAWFVPLIAYVCGIIGIVLAVKYRKTNKTTLALIICIAAIILGVVSNYIASVAILNALNEKGLI